MTFRPSSPSYVQPQQKLDFQNQRFQKNQYVYDASLIPLESQRLPMIIDIDKTLVDVILHSSYQQFSDNQKQIFNQKKCEFKEIQISYRNQCNGKMEEQKLLVAVLKILDPYNRKQVHWDSSDHNNIVLLKTFAPLSQLTDYEKKNLSEIPLYIDGQINYYCRDYHIMTLDESVKDKTLNALTDKLIECYQEVNWVKENQLKEQITLENPLSQPNYLKIPIPQIKNLIVEKYPISFEFQNSYICLNYLHGYFSPICLMSVDESQVVCLVKQIIENVQEQAENLQNNNSINQAPDFNIHHMEILDDSQLDPMTKIPLFLLKNSDSSKQDQESKNKATLNLNNWSPENSYFTQNQLNPDKVKQVVFLVAISSKNLKHWPELTQLLKLNRNLDEIKQENMSKQQIPRSNYKVKIRSVQSFINSYLKMKVEK
eukprot:403339002